MRVVAVVNQKGGCGKTTTAIHLAACLAFLQKRVLLIDLDPQGHATCGLGVKAEFLERTTYDLFQSGTVRTEEIILPLSEQLSIIPTHNILGRVELESSAREGGAFERLKKKIEELKTPFDYVLIDSPPNLGFLTYNALQASREVIIPIEPSFFSLHGLAKIFETIESLNQSRARPIRIHALMTRFDKRIKLGREVRAEVKKHFQDQTFHHVIHENVKLREAAAAGKSIVDFDREALGFNDYMGLAIEVIERGLLAAEEEPESPANIEASEKGGESILSGGSSGRGQESKEVVSLEVEGVTQAPDEKPSEKTDETGIENNELKENRKETVESVFELFLNGRPYIAVEKVKEKAEQPKKEERQQEVWEEMVQEVRESYAPREVLGGVLFSYLDKEVHSVMIAGDFNRWITEPMTLVDEIIGLWQKIVPVQKNNCHYKFLVDNVWQTDRFNSVTEPNPYGGIDSVLKLSQTEERDETGKETPARVG